MSRVPAPLDELGAVFVPIPPGAKGTTRPRTPEHLYEPDDPVLEAYLEAGHNYGIACPGGLAVLDADDPDRLSAVIDALPETVWQVSGSGEGEHYFMRVPGFNQDLKLFDPATDDHLGEVKAAEQSYVVGPGSRHPSGGRYGPLQGETIATVEESHLRELLEPFVRESSSTPADRERPPMRGLSRARIDRDADLSVHDVVSPGRYPEGARREHPFHGSETGANFMVDEHAETFRCWRHDCTGNARHLVGVELGIIDCGEWIPGGLDSNTWSEISDAARDAGYDLPDYSPQADPVAVLPPLATEWDWRGAARGETGTDLTIDAARERTQEDIKRAYKRLDDRLVEAIPTGGKSYGAIAAAAATGAPITVLTGRGRKEQYDQFEEWCEEHGLRYETLPSFTRDCPTANGEHGDDWKQTVRGWYNRGATPQAIHKYAHDVLDERLPCQKDGTCPYAYKWDFDPEDYDVLIGHYTHAHKRKVTQGRTVVFDEFPDGAYETYLSDGLAGAVTAYLETKADLPFEDYTDLIENRGDDQRRADALAWFQDRDLVPDEGQVFADDAGHAAAPLAVFTLLASATNDLGNGWERANLGDDRVGLHNRSDGSITLLSPPPLDYTRNVVALDGTPTVEMWELALGRRMNHREVLTQEERGEYIQDALGLKLIRTTDAVKPYNSADHVNVEQDAALLEEIADEHGRRPAVITSRTAELAYGDDGVDELASDTEHYGNVLGSNKFETTRLGAVIGSNHYGDPYIEKWGAFAGEAVERGDGKGADLSYGEFGDRILTHMREHDTLQAAMRFGRDGNGAVVYVHTDTLPEWVPIAGEGRVIQTWGTGMRQVLGATNELDEWTTAEIAADPRVGIGERQVREHLHRLAKDGYLSADVEGCGFVWRNDGLHRVNEHGDVELEAVALDELGAAESAELARTVNYTWDFRTSRPTSADGTDDPPGGETSPSSERFNRGDSASHGS